MEKLRGRKNSLSQIKIRMGQAIYNLLVF